MTFDFTNRPTQEFPHFKGGEGTMLAQMEFDGLNRILHAILPVGASIGEHTHETNSEILFVIRGEGTIIDNGVSSPIHAGMCTYCKKGNRHSLVNTSNDELEFYAVVPEQ